MGAEHCPAFIWTGEQLLCRVVPCTTWAWISSFESFSPLPSGFLSRLGLVGILNVDISNPFCVLEAFSWFFHIIFPPFPGLSIRHTAVENLRVWLQVAFWRESGCSSVCSPSADLSELPYKDTFWFVCSWREGSIDLRAKQAFSLIFFQEKYAQFPHVLSFRGLSKQFVQIGPAKSHYWC